MLLFVCFGCKMAGLSFRTAMCSPCFMCEEKICIQRRRGQRKRKKAAGAWQHSIVMEASKDLSGKTVAVSSLSSSPLTQ